MVMRVDTLDHTQPLLSSNGDIDPCPTRTAMDRRSSILPHSRFEAGRHLDLNQLRETILNSQQRGETLPKAAEQIITVDRDGNIATADPTSLESRDRTLSEVHQGVFATDELVKAIDLNQVRDTLFYNQERAQNLPMKRAQQILVDREGNIQQGSDMLNPEAEKTLSEVPQSVFAMASTARLEREAAAVAEKLPHNTRLITADGVSGWLYTIKSEMGDTYNLFLYHDGSYYQVQVVTPRVEGKYSPHSGHLYQDGRICFGDSIGLPTLEMAYAKSVLWATGFSVFLRTGEFPFNR